MFLLLWMVYIVHVSVEMTPLVTHTPIGRGSAKSKSSGVPMDPRTNTKWGSCKKYWGPNQGSTSDGNLGVGRRLWLSHAFVHVRTTLESLGTPKLVQVSEIGGPNWVLGSPGPQNSS